MTDDGAVLELDDGLVVRLQGLAGQNLADRLQPHGVMQSLTHRGQGRGGGGLIQVSLLLGAAMVTRAALPSAMHPQLQPPLQLQLPVWLARQPRYSSVHHRHPHPLRPARASYFVGRT